MKLLQPISLHVDKTVRMQCIVCDQDALYSQMTYGRVVTREFGYCAVQKKNGDRVSVKYSITFTGRVCPACLVSPTKHYVFQVKDERV